MKPHAITILSQPNCKWCDKAKELAMKLGTTVLEFDITKNPDKKALLKERGLTTVPQIWDGDAHIGGYEAFEKHVKERYQHG